MSSTVAARHRPIQTDAADAVANPAFLPESSFPIMDGAARTHGSTSDLDREFVQVNDLRVAHGFMETLQQNALDSLDRLFRVEGADFLRKPGLDGWRERVRISLRSLDREVSCEGDAPAAQRTFFMKRYSRPPRRALRRGRRAVPDARTLAGVEWHWLCRLARDGVAAPTPVAIGEEASGGRERRSALVMSAVPGESAESLLARPRRLEPRQVREAARSLADLVSRFHGLGYVHQDLYMSHVFAAWDVDGEARWSLIDLQRVRHSARRSMRRIVKDLAALNFSAPPDRVSRSERLRWLCRYLGIRRLDAAGRRLVYRVAGKTRQIRRHQARRESRLAVGGGSR